MDIYTELHFEKQSVEIFFTLLGKPLLHTYTSFLRMSTLNVSDIPVYPPKSILSYLYRVFYYRGPNGVIPFRTLRSLHSGPMCSTRMPNNHPYRGKSSTRVGVIFKLEF